MCVKKDYRKYSAMLFAALYLFVALFSQNFHEHGSGAVLKDLQLRGTERQYKTTTDFAYSDCLSCHLLHDAKFVPSFGAPFEIFTSVSFAQDFSLLSSFWAAVSQHPYPARGPPAYFI